MKRIFGVDNEMKIVEVVNLYLKKVGYGILNAKNGREDLDRGECKKLTKV